MTDHPTILEQIDSVEWAEVQVKRLGRLASLDKRQAIGLGLTARQLRELRSRLEAAAETLRTLEFGSEIAR
jgi:hypothetical protein